MGLERSWVSNSRNWRVMGLASTRGVPMPPTPSVPPVCTLMLTTGVLMMGRLGTLGDTGVREPTQGAPKPTLVPQSVLASHRHCEGTSFYPVLFFGPPFLPCALFFGHPMCTILGHPLSHLPNALPPILRHSLCLSALRTPCIPFTIPPLGTLRTPLAPSPLPPRCLVLH